MKKAISSSSSGKPWHENPAELAKRRREAGLSQLELANRTGRSRSLIRDLELGKVRLRGKIANDVWEAVATATPPRITHNAFADRIFGRLPWTSEKNEVPISVADLLALTQRIEKAEAQLAEISIAIRLVNEKCDDATAEQGARILKQEEKQIARLPKSSARVLAEKGSPK